MNKVTLAMLGPLPEPETTTLPNGITVQRRIPTEDILAAIQWCSSFIVYDKPFISETLYTIVENLGILRFFTNVDTSFMDKPTLDLHEIYSDYDLIEGHGLLPAIIAAIDAAQLSFFRATLRGTIESIIKYRNSAAGIIEVLSNQAKTDTAAIEQNLALMEDKDKMGEIQRLLQFYGNNVLTPKEE